MKLESPESRTEIPVSENPNSVQSNENLPSPVDKRMRKLVCPFCQDIRYVKTSDRFSIQEIFSTEELKGTVGLIVSRRFSTQTPLGEISAALIRG